jgi:hypothetical protein
MNAMALLGGPGQSGGTFAQQMILQVACMRHLNIEHRMFNIERRRMDSLRPAH